MAVPLEPLDRIALDDASPILEGQGRKVVEGASRPVDITGTWFNWVKTYSALAGYLGFIALRFVKWRGKDGKTHYLYEKRWALCFPPLILAINIAEAVIRDFQVFGFALWKSVVVETL